MFNALSSDLLLGLGFEEEFVNPADRQRLRQIVKGAVLGAAATASALFFAANREALYVRGAQQIGRDFDQAEQMLPALPEGERRFTAESKYPSHRCGEDKKCGTERNKKESAG